jgi:uncharacterized lipoprotein YehR (DUF1307 family)
MRRLLLLAFVMALAACGATEPSHQLVTLPSGKQIKVLGVWKMVFTNDTPALMLKYQTDISLDNKADLEKEVEEIWASFRVDVEKAQLTNAIVSANEKPTGFIFTKSRLHNFVFKRGAGGQWSKT